MALRPLLEFLASEKPIRIDENRALLLLVIGKHYAQLSFVRGLPALN